MVLAAIVSNFYIFVYQKNYDFIVEAECNPEEQVCFIRDCSEEDSCPPNGLERYRIFNLKARDVKKCADNSCLVECVSGIISCTEVFCDEFAGDTCISVTQ